jgi:enoyl-[acyl-carrier protein] reductase III
MIDLTGRVALVTGGSRGIGRACALRLAEAGADVVINYVTSQTAAEDVAAKVQALGRRAATVKADVGQQEDVAAMMQFVGENFGKLDILLSNAATGGFRPLLATDTRHFEAAMRINVLALVYLLQSGCRLLERSEGRAKVIALSSHGSHLALPMYGLIGGAKAALESLVRYFALELGGRGINVNVIKSGLVETDSTRALPKSEAIFAARRSKSLTGDRLLTPEDVADAVLYLASPLSDMVQGETLTVDGGMGIHVAR